MEKVKTFSPDMVGKVVEFRYLSKRAIAAGEAAKLIRGRVVAYYETNDTAKIEVFDEAGNVAETKNYNGVNSVARVSNGLTSHAVKVLD